MVFAVNVLWVAVSLIVLAGGVAAGVYVVVQLNRRWFVRMRRDDGRPRRSR